MTVRECYDRLGADYEGVVSRLVTEERVKKFIIRLSEDRSFAGLCTAMEQENAEEAFMGAHTLKGIAMNLGLTRITEIAGALTEELRGGKITQEAFDLFSELENPYMETIRFIGMLSEQGGNVSES